MEIRLAVGRAEPDLVRAARAWCGVEALFELITVGLAAHYQSRRTLPAPEHAGFTIRRSERFEAGTVERLGAVKATVAPST